MNTAILCSLVQWFYQKLMHVYWDFKCELDCAKWEERPIENKKAREVRTKRPRKSLLSRMIGKRSGGKRQVSKLLGIPHSFFESPKNFGTRLSSIRSQGTSFHSTERLKGVMLTLVSTQATPQPLDTTNDSY